MIASAAPTLRPYQDAQIERVRGCFSAGRRRVLLVAVTGAGKTVMACALIALALGKRKRVLFIAHRTELIQQAVERLAHWGIGSGIIQAGHPAEVEQRVQVASVQTLARRLKRPAVAAPPGWEGHVPALAFDLVVIDEAHHATAAQYQAVLEAYPQARVVGLTATPYRLDGSGLGDVFDVLEAGPQIGELVRDGYLVQPVVFAPPPPQELARLRLTAGEYRQDDAAAVLNRTAPITELVQSWQTRAAGRTSVGFGCTVEHSEHLAAAFCAAGVPASSVCGATPPAERAARLAALARGELRVLFNAMVLTEGWDLPACSAVILARPTMSRCLWRQMCGRGLRSAPGKADCVILDHVGSVHRFGMVDDPDTYDLAGDQTEVVGRVPLCGRCQAAMGPADVCPVCGWVQPERTTDRLGRVVAVRREVELRQASTITTDERRQLYWEWLNHASVRRFAAGWAAHRYRERFGCYPPQQWRETYPGAA